MTLDAAGLALIADHEGVRLKAYQDSGGVWTIGYGHTATAKKGMVITQETALRLLTADVRRFEECVSKTIAVPLTQNQFNALVSLAFNRGCGGFRSSKVVSLINAGRAEEAAAVWLTTAVTVNGKKLGGLVKRRKNESAMFAVGDERNLAAGATRLTPWLFFGAAKALSGRV